MALVFLTGLACLTWVSVQDYRRHVFNAVNPVVSLLAITLLYFFTSASFNPGTGFLLNLGYAAILFGTGTMRIGDLLPLLVYTSVYSSTQSFFTLLMATGLYLYTYPRIKDKEVEELEWVPFIPAVLNAYLIQTLFTAV
jgi:hypothetical protein